MKRDRKFWVGRIIAILAGVMLGMMPWWHYTTLVLLMLVVAYGFNEGWIVWGKKKDF